MNFKLYFMIKEGYTRLLNKYEELEKIANLFIGTEYVDDWECIYEFFVNLFDSELPKIYRYLDLQFSSDRYRYYHVLGLNNRIRNIILKEYSILYKEKKSLGIPKDLYKSSIINDKYISKIKHLYKGVNLVHINFRLITEENSNIVKIDGKSIEEVKDIINNRILTKVSNKTCYYISKFDFINNIFNYFGEDLGDDQELQNLIYNYRLLF